MKLIRYSKITGAQGRVTSEQLIDLDSGYYYQFFTGTEYTNRNEVGRIRVFGKNLDVTLMEHINSEEVYKAFKDLVKKLRFGWPGVLVLELKDGKYVKTSEKILERK